MTGLIEDTEYEFAVRAENKAGMSEGSVRMEEPVKTKAKIGKSCFDDQLCLFGWFVAMVSFLKHCVDLFFPQKVVKMCFSVEEGAVFIS